MTPVHLRHRAVRRSPAIAVILLAVATGVPAARVAAQTQGLSVASLLGQSGGGRLFHVPTATAVPAGRLDVGFDNGWDPSVFPHVARERSVYLDAGIFPRVTLSARGTLAYERKTSNILGSDLSANVEVLVLAQKKWRPALAAGVGDIGGAVPFFRARYAVISETFSDRARLTVGFGTGPDVLDGVFGGVELAVTRWLAVMGEHDAHALSGGLRVYPVPERLVRSGVPRPVLNIVAQEGGHLSVGAGIRAVLGGEPVETPRNPGSAPRFARNPPGGAPFVDLERSIQARLIELGLENVRVRFRGDAPNVAAVIEYENRRYNRDELDALGLVFGTVATLTPAEVTTVRAIVSEVGIPVLDISSGADALIQFANGELAASAFAAQLVISLQPHLPSAGTRAESGARENSSAFKVDLFLRPRIESSILTEVGVADFRFTALPDAYVRLAPGLVLNARAALPVGKTDGFIGPEQHAQVDRILLHQAVRIPLGASTTSAGGLTQVSVGRFDAERVGISNETAFSISGGQFFLKGTVGRFGDSYSALTQWVILGSGRVRYAPWDATLNVTGGRFLDGDDGVSVDASRFFGSAEVGVFIRHAARGSIAGGRFSVPLTVARELRPSRMRVRLPDVYAYEQRAEVLTDRNTLRNDVGRGLATEHELERIYWNRDRSYASYIRRHVDTMKRAMDRWVADAH